jgi:hypothetical protein
MSSSDLADLWALQHRLEQCTATLAADPADVLSVGQAVLTFADREQGAFFPLLPLLDPAARAELEREHRQLAEDLELLRWLVATTPDSPDMATLADALVPRLRMHIARDGRLLAHALRLATR